MLALFARTGVLAGLGIAAGLLFNGLRPDGVSFGTAPPAAACKLAEAAQTVEHLSPEQANHLCGNPNVMIADARSAEAFAKGHVAGAVHLPCVVSGGVAQGVPDLLVGRSRVVVYGETTAEALAVADGLVRRNTNAGLRIAVLEGGFGAWQLAGFACASGPCRECTDGKTGNDLVWPGPEGTGGQR